MHYDLDLLQGLCEGLSSVRVERTAARLEVELLPGAILCFVNLDPPGDSLIGFKDSPWHVHGGFVFSDGRHYIEATAEEMVLGLADGSVLVCERWENGEFRERWLEHREYLTELSKLQAGEEIRVGRVR